MMAGTIITAAGTVTITGRTVTFCQKLAERNAELCGMEFGEVNFKASGPKMVFTVSHSTLEK